MGEKADADAEASAIAGAASAEPQEATVPMSFMAAVAMPASQPG